METVRYHIKAIAWVLIVLLAFQTIGCASFVPLDGTPPMTKEAKVDARLRVLARDEATYVFPANQYSVRYHADSTVASVKGWGDKYTSFGLVDRGYFELTSGQLKRVEIEKLETGQVVLIAGAVVGLSVLAYLGVKVVGGDAGSGRGKTETPAEGN